MQDRALREIYELGAQVRRRNNPALLELWRRLQTSDHFYYMCTKWLADGDVHAYFSPYEGPYDAFIYYMNVLRDLAENLVDQDGLSQRPVDDPRPHAPTAS